MDAKFEANGDSEEEMEEYIGEEETGEEEIGEEEIGEEEFGNDGKKIFEVLPCPYDDCFKSFHSKWSLTRHVRTHTGEKPFLCNFPGCGKGFVQKCSMKRHLQTHSAAKLYTCSECGKKFKLKEYLDTHRKTHERGRDSEAGREGGRPTMNYSHAASPNFSSGVNRGASSSLTESTGLEATGINSSGIPDSGHIIGQLQRRLVRYSIRYQEQVQSSQATLNDSIKTASMLRAELIECASTLIEAGHIIQSILGENEVPENIKLKIQKFASYIVESEQGGEDL